MPAMAHTIRIKKDAPHGLVFEVASSSGTLLARSNPYISICKLEAALSVLTAAAKAAKAVSIDTDGHTTWVTPGGRKSRVALEGGLSDDRVTHLLMGVASATVIDDRPPEARRSDLSGRLCDLAH